MNTRHLFKAVCKETKQLVTGYLYVRKDGTHEINFYNEEYDCERYMHEVEEDTVCQCIGHTDCEGTLIFEHDMVEVTIFDHNGIDHQYLCEVIYTESGLWFVDEEHEHYFAQSDYDFDLAASIKVVGSKFENKKLKTCVSLRELFDSGIQYLEYGGRIICTDDGGVCHYDLYKDDDNEDSLLLCDGETVTFENWKNDEKCISGISEYGKKIYLSKKEFDIAVFHNQSEETDDSLELL